MTQPNSGHLAGTVGEPTNQAPKHSALPWDSKFVEMGGYDCMTDAQYIYSGAQLVAEVDYSDYGQPWCEPASDNTKAEADANAALIVEAVNFHATLLERVAKLEEVIAEICRAIEDYAPEDNVALNQAWFLAVEAAKP